MRDDTEKHSTSISLLAKEIYQISDIRNTDKKINYISPDNSAKRQLAAENHGKTIFRGKELHETR